MDIEHLNRTQIILLTLLVSFVTSIATGIVTVTLLAQAPQGVTQTINRVVERTVERVVPDVSKNQIAATKEVTVVVKEDDLITDSIEKNRGMLVRIVSRLADEPGTVAGIGEIVDSSGTVATARSIFSEGLTYTAVTPMGDEVSFKILNLESKSPVALLQLSAKKDGPKFSQARLSDPGGLKLGQSVIALSGESRTEVAIGIVSGFERENESATSTITIIQSNIEGSGVLPGSPLINIFGEVIGIRTLSVPARGSSYIPSLFIAAELRSSLQASTTQSIH